ncbi:radical SAM protein [Desulfolithobacter dissulfuricans]|uniref:Radical SAM protein n=1 Tax=Desulfolithobacter dissulfuricans TaxID=2795293 RepID=A0A915U9V0_9BACT|nr:radical SAM protein [Desulfolithobacter dissulfuricans]BCO08750.1 radical SAM protein [Desulfolithobacter dissulfuricans]
MEKTGKKSARPGGRHNVVDGRRRQAWSLLESCSVCPRRCGVNRLDDQVGLCQVGRCVRVASFGPHFGEEAPLVGRNGSGTIFFEGCNLRCVFCQNYDISHIDDQGLSPDSEVDDRQLARIMLELQSMGSHNINLVTPSHVVPQILAGLEIAVAEGLDIPLVYNTSAYDSVETLRLLDGIVDIYMPDCKFWVPDSAGRYAGARDYPEVMRQAVREMHRQVGDLEIGPDGLARRGLLVRHLVMPGMLDETGAILSWLAEEISPATYINIMDQYHPCGQAHRYPEIDRPLRPGEYAEALELARQAGLTRLDQRDLKTLLERLGILGR